MKKKRTATYPEKCCVSITGKLQTMTQDTAIRLIHEAGCAFAFTVGPDTTCLIVGKDPSGQDMMTAERFNICLMWEEQFTEKVTLPNCGKERDKIIEVSDEHKIAITGTLESMTRQNAINAIEQAGYSYSPSITEQTTHLVVGMSPGLEKIAKADGRSVAFVLEKLFLQMVGAPHTGTLPGIE